MQESEDLLRRAARHLGLGEQPLAIAVDALGGDPPERRVLAELGNQVHVHDVAVAPHRRMPTLAVVLDVAEPLVARRPEGHRAARLAQLPSIAGYLARALERPRLLKRPCRFLALPPVDAVDDDVARAAPEDAGCLGLDHRSHQDPPSSRARSRSAIGPASSRRRRYRYRMAPGLSPFARRSPTRSSSPASCSW